MILKFHISKFCFLVVIFLTISFLSSRGCYLTTGITSKASYDTISVSEAKELIENNTDLFILDVRTETEYKEGHIESAYLIPYLDIKNRQDELPTNKSQAILVYCRSGTRSATASSTLDSLNYTQVNNLEGGFTEWKNAGYPFETGSFVEPNTNTTVGTTSIVQTRPSSKEQTSASLTISSTIPAFELAFIIQVIGLFLITLKKLRNKE